MMVVIMRFSPLTVNGNTGGTGGGDDDDGDDGNDGDGDDGDGGERIGAYQGSPNIMLCRPFPGLLGTHPRLGWI